MGGNLRAAALVAAALGTATASADDLPRPIEPTRADVTTLETSLRLRSNWTEIAFRGKRPKAWDNIVSPEVRATLRVLEGLFEAKAEIGLASDNFTAHANNDVDALRGELGLGVNTGTWSYLVEWKTRDVFEPGYDDFLVGLNTYDARIRHRFQEKFFTDLQPTLFQLSAAGGYVASTPHLFAKNFAEFELEIVQRFGGGVTLLIAPKLELSDYLDFAGEDRKDAVLTLRVAPTVNIAAGLTLSLEGQAIVAVSTLDAKTGESWELAPIVRFQQSL
jgi:hypothetical protein